MAHTRTTNKDARIIAQCSSGKYIRRVETVCFSVALDRATNVDPRLIMASVIQNEAAVKGIFTAPCDGKVLSVYANGSPYVDMAAGGTVYVQVRKAVIGGSDITLTTGSGILVGEATLGTAITSDVANDGTLSATSSDLDLLSGQHVYATLTVSNHAVDARGFITVNVEWMPSDASSFSS